MQKNSLFLTYGKYMGYIFSYMLFTTILYFILFFSHKIPDSWNYFHMLFITAAIAMLGFFLEKWLQ